MHPVLFELGDVPVYSYGVMLGSSILAAWYIVMHLGTTKEELTREVMGPTFILTAISAIFFARVLFVLTNLEHFDTAGDFFALRQGGLVAYGGFLGGVLGSWLYLRRKDANLLAWMDVVAPTLGIGLGLTRIGCYLYGCDYGTRLSESAPSWLRDIGTFPRWTSEMVSPTEAGHGSAAWVHHVAAYDLSPLADYSHAVHPTQLYESLFGFALAGLAFFLWPRRRFRGQIILAVTFLYACWRFLIEYVRDDPERGFYFGFSTSQLISMALIPIAGLAYFQLRKREGQMTSSPPEPSPSPITESPKADRGDKAKKTASKRPKRRKRKRK